MADNERLRLPPLTQEPIKYFDSTPTPDYPLRILRAYRADCDSRWEVHGIDEAERRIYDMMNEFQEQRAKLLDEAIRMLEEKP